MRYKEQHSSGDKPCSFFVVCASNTIPDQEMSFVVVERRLSNGVIPWQVTGKPFAVASAAVARVAVNCVTADYVIVQKQTPLTASP
jgi:hypothetical protein